MISAQIKAGVDSRFSEVRKLFAHIQNLDSKAATDQDSVSAESATILRGLIFVHLYGAFEYAVTLSVQVLLQEITKVAVPYCEFEHLFHAIALDSDFKSVSDSGWKGKWPKRRSLLQRQVSAEVCTLNDTVFHNQLQNIWYETLSDLFEYLCISVKPVPEDRMRGYIDEVVDHRNGIAHGRLSAQEVGRGKTVEDIEKRLRAIIEVVDHILNCFDDLLANREFVETSRRPNYLGSDVADQPPLA